MIKQNKINNNIVSLSFCLIKNTEMSSNLNNYLHDLRSESYRRLDFIDDDEKLMFLFTKRS